MVSGYDHYSSVAALAKQLLMDTQGMGDITLPKETVKLLCEAITSHWSAKQMQTSSEFKKV